ncbi:MAG TPA: DUF1552 domain-containing protein [Polyangia bacterium]|nr:DUF1552 domain-containing protein [Polyangia bacterium]
MNRKTWTRRQVLRGAGVALSLPWLETFAPRTAKAQAAAAKRRYVVLYFPNGSAEYWHPSSTVTGTATGDQWNLSPILAPLEPIKKYVSVLQNVGYQTALQMANPSHGQLAQAMLTCTQPDLNPAVARAGTSVDQLIANALAANPATKTVFPSLQVGLSTMDSYTDGTHPANSRSISWSTPTNPLYKVINPQAVFDSIVGPANQAAGTAMAPDPAAIKRLALQKSSLDYIVEQSTALKTRLSHSDSGRVDLFMTSVRNLENRLLDVNAMMTAGCTVGTRPTQTYSVSAFTGSGNGKVMAGYDRNLHADTMIDVVMMALQCDLTRVVTFMLDDARSDFPYLFLKLRNFTAGGSQLATTSVSNGNISSGLSGFHGLQHAGDTNDGYATINYWLSDKATSFATKLMNMSEGAGNILDNTTIHYGSGMHGGNHQGIDIPLALIGGHGGALKTNAYFPWAMTPQLLQNVHLTVMQKVFSMTMSSFAGSTGIVPDLVA